MSYLLAVMLLAQLSPSGVASLTAEEQQLKATYEAWIDAWNTGKIEIIGEIASANFGFGRDVPFPRPPARNRATYENGLRGYFNLMDDIGYEADSTNYRVVGSTGFVWGYYSQTTKQKTGPSRTVYGRQSLTFIKEAGKWKLMMYHRSNFPSEFTR